MLKMSSQERQKLLYFATGSSVLPALDNRVGNNGMSFSLLILHTVSRLVCPFISSGEKSPVTKSSYSPQGFLLLILKITAKDNRKRIELKIFFRY